MGKTTYALISGWNSAMAGNVVVFFSLEMPANQLKSKLIGLLTGIDYRRIKKGSLSSEELSAVLEADKYIDASNFHIDDKAKTIEEITERSANYIKNFGAKLFFLDYIQRTTSRDSKVQIRELVTIISRECKSIARDNYVAFVALSQLSRAVEARPNKRPKLSDLKESSSIEEDADIVAFLFRQAYYDEMEGQQPGFSEMFHTEFIVAKGRDIGTDVIHLFINPINMTINGYNSQGEY
jgi:replicative DNA helicase